jgi:hypothetical protein
LKAVANRSYVIRNQKVMLDSGLAGLYHLPTKRLNEAVSRNSSRFPADFMFQLSADEVKSLGGRSRQVLSCKPIVRAYTKRCGQRAMSLKYCAGGSPMKRPDDPCNASTGGSFTSPHRWRDRQTRKQISIRPVESYTGLPFCASL